MNKRNSTKFDWSSKAPRPIISDDFNFSTGNGLAQTELVILNSNQRPSILSIHKGSILSIVNTKLETGLIFLTPWKLLRNSATKNSRLHFISVTFAPLTIADLTRTLNPWHELVKLSSQLISLYSELTSNFYHIYANDGQMRQANIYAWFLDYFSPSITPTCGILNFSSRCIILTTPNNFETSTCVSIV